MKTALQRIIPVALALSVVALLQACYPGDSVSTVERDLVITKYDNTVDFGTYRTFAVDDSVHYLADSTDDIHDERPFEAHILKTVRDNMLALGYTEETDPENNIPDLALIAAVTTSTWYGTYYYGYPGWGWGWGWYYPGYWGTYSYETGTIIVDMLDAGIFKEPKGDEDALVIWQGGINGLLTGTTSQTQSRISTRLDQAFNQSPYLGAK